MGTVLSEGFGGAFLGGGDGFKGGEGGEGRGGSGGMERGKGGERGQGGEGGEGAPLLVSAADVFGMFHFSLK